MHSFKDKLENILISEYGVQPSEASVTELYNAVSEIGMEKLMNNWTSQRKDNKKKRACYFSAEFLIGRLVYSNLMNLGLLNDCKEALQAYNISPDVFEQIEDDALGNGGLGRLAACFLDSAATHNIMLDGFGIRYRYGLFRQSFENGFQVEEPDNWTRFGDPWSVRRDNESVVVKFGDQTVVAVPYDMPVIGYGGKTINTLRLWQSEAINPFDLKKFNNGKYDLAVKEKNDAEAISAVLYPDDTTEEGKKLRLKQQYFFSCASLRCLIDRYVKEYGTDFSKFSQCYAIQLNDTHPVVSIPEFIRILVGEYSVKFCTAFRFAVETFAYTNHTVMAEALEKWNVALFREVLPDVYPYVVMINDYLVRELKEQGISNESVADYAIINENLIHMARLAIYVSHSTNGVAKIHTEILKNDALEEWYRLYPERFNNKTNGITQRRWLMLCNPELSEFITDRIGNGWIKNLCELKKLENFADDENSLEQFAEIKHTKKQQLCDYIRKNEGVVLNPNFIFDIQIKRLHEYKRQLLNILSVLDTYFCIKDGTIKDFYPTAYIFGAKSAPGYARAKGIIKLIHETGKLINNDKATNDKMKVLFVKNYNVSYAEKLIPAADVSEQISTAGTEASGTGNMKLMLNGAVTSGTMDGANIEIVEQAGRENNYIFGADVDMINSVKDNYNPLEIYNNNIRVKRVLDALVDGTLDDNNTGVFEELRNALLYGASWHKADHYYVLLDFDDYCRCRYQLNKDYSKRRQFTKKAFMNTANAGKFSSDRTVMEYADDIWGLNK